MELEKISSESESSDSVQSDNEPKKEVLMPPKSYSVKTEEPNNE